MILSRLGKPVDEESLCGAWAGSKGGYELHNAAGAFDGKYLELDPDVPRNHEYLRFLLGEPRWIIAQVFSREIGRFAEAMTPPPRSRFSPLSQSPLGAMHVVLLVSTDEAGFRYLDPYYDATGQPFWISHVDFVSAWQGRIAVSPPFDDV